MNFRRYTIPIALSLACLALAVSVPGWRYSLAQVGGYDSNFVGCATNQFGDFVVELAQGPDISDDVIGEDCDLALNALPASCEFAAEGLGTQAIGRGNSAYLTLFRIVCK